MGQFKTNYEILCCRPCLRGLRLCQGSLYWTSSGCWLWLSLCLWLHCRCSRSCCGCCRSCCPCLCPRCSRSRLRCCPCGRCPCGLRCCPCCLRRCSCRGCCLCSHCVHRLQLRLRSRCVRLPWLRSPRCRRPRCQGIESIIVEDTLDNTSQDFIQIRNRTNTQQVTKQGFHRQF